MTFTGEETRRFYYEVDWTRRDGQLFDRGLFGHRELGPTRFALHEERLARVRASLRRAGPPLTLLEVGCGGQPALELLDLCKRYIGVDFSARGLDEARRFLDGADVPYTLFRARADRLPLATASVDAVYCSHVLHQIPDAADQASALREIGRVLRPGGVAVMLVANPRPLLSPVRLFRQLMADTPYLGDVLKQLRRPTRVPFRTMSLRWMRKQLEPYGTVDVSCYALESRWVNKHVSETSLPGKVLWLLQHALESRLFDRIAALGSAVEVDLKKAGSAPAPVLRLLN
jgi:ubiquinone/menaquinone biosynthesis C-methylase UbiE